MGDPSARFVPGTASLVYEEGHTLLCECGDHRGGGAGGGDAGGDCGGGGERGGDGGDGDGGGRGGGGDGNGLPQMYTWYGPWKPYPRGISPWSASSQLLKLYWVGPWMSGAEHWHALFGRSWYKKEVGTEPYCARHHASQFDVDWMDGGDVLMYVKEIWA